MLLSLVRIRICLFFKYKAELLSNECRSCYNGCVKVLVISGSLRKSSYNTALARAAVSLAPEGVEITVYTLENIPLYNMDVEEQGFPDSVLQLKKAVKEADGIVWMSPEHNHSVPGVLKNAIDWVSRGENEWREKPLAIGGGSDGIISTARAQMHLLVIANTLRLHPMSRPLFQVPNVDKKINEHGDLVDEKTKVKLKEFLTAFKDWIERLS